MSTQTLVRRDDEVLDVLGLGWMTAGDLAREMRMGVKDTVSLLKGMANRGLVVRKVATDDSAIVSWGAA